MIQLEVLGKGQTRGSNPPSLNASSFMSWWQDGCESMRPTKTWMLPVKACTYIQLRRNITCTMCVFLKKSDHLKEASQTHTVRIHGDEMLAIALTIIKSSERLYCTCTFIHPHFVPSSLLSSWFEYSWEKSWLE